MSPSAAVTLSEQELSLILAKKDIVRQLVFGFLLLFFKQQQRFPETNDQIFLKETLFFLGNALQIPPADYLVIVQQYLDNQPRTVRLFKQEIRLLLGFRIATLDSKSAFITYCQTYIFPYAFKSEQVLAQAYDYFKEQKLEPYSKQQLQRFLKEAHYLFEQTLFANITNSLSENTKRQLDQLLKCTDDERKGNTDDTKLKVALSIAKLTSASKPINFIELKDASVELKMQSIVWAVQKHQHLKQLQLPTTLENKGCSRKLLMQYYERISREKPSKIARYQANSRYAYLAIFCYIRQQLSADTLADLLLKLLKRINTKATNYVDKKLKADSKSVSGKMGTLLVLAKKAMENPDGVIADIIYPVVSQERLNAIINDLGDDEDWYQMLVKTKALSLYTHNNRQLVWQLVDALDFDAETKLYPILKALRFLGKLQQFETTPRGDSIKQRLYASSILEQLVPKTWTPLVIASYHDNKKKVKINWHGLELSLFATIQIELDIKDIWVKQSFRYRDYKQDLPLDFDENEDFYFKLLNLPKDPKDFTKSLKDRLQFALKGFNESILSNPKVKIKKRKKKGAIRLTPFEPQSDPVNLDQLKTTIAKMWPHLQLIDILKETAYRIGFFERFQSVGAHEAIPKNKLQKRLLLCLFGIGTNTGIKRVSSLGELYDDLRYVKKRYITAENVRFAIQDVINELLEIKDPEVWGYGTTISAADSKKMSVWDQNLMAEWHARYGGRGVMIYWHVDKNGLCIHSMLKTCASSEVASMIHGILHHDTKMDLDKLAVDTHGQSTIGFGFSELFNFELLPRLKDLHKQKLYCASTKEKSEYKNLADALASEAIVWRKIEHNYREMVKHAVALKIRTVEPEVMLRRLSANNKENPVYQSLLEVGKAARTIFLCRYLSSEELRIEINEALNVVERVNSLMRFIFYGKDGEISTNREQDQELAILCLHLLQVCMCYITTILIQTTLSDPKWTTVLTKEDMRALSPLFYGHINPYGLLSLDMDARILIEKHLFKGEIYA